MKSDTRFFAWLIVAAVVTFVCAVTMCTCLETVQAHGIRRPHNPLERVVHAQSSSKDGK